MLKDKRKKVSFRDFCLKLCFFKFAFHHMALDICGRGEREEEKQSPIHNSSLIPARKTYCFLLHKNLDTILNCLEDIYDQDVAQQYIV